MELITHKIKSNWGTSIYFMEKSGIAFARLYWYKDSSEIGYLCSLSVDENYRCRGFGKYLQEFRENLAKELGMTEIRLWVETNSWMRFWYERRGYVYYQDYSDVEIWMSKKLKDETV